MIPQNSPSQWKTALLLGATIFFSFVYFYEGGGWNQNSRFDLLRAIVERHTLKIDAYHQNTEDKAHFREHYYSDKAPGLVLLALPIAFAARPVIGMFGVDPMSPRGEFILSYVVTAGSVALPTTLAAVWLFLFGCRIGGTAAGAFGALVLALGTPIWAYANLFWAHALVGSCLVYALAAGIRIGSGASQRSDFFWALCLGLAAGWATVTEYPAAPASTILAFFALSRAWSHGSGTRWTVIVGVSLGAGICLIVLLGYLYLAFGSVRPSYSYYDPNSFTFMQQHGYLGLTYPHPDRLLKLLFQCRRGLFFLSPVVICAPFGLVYLYRSTLNRAAAATAAAIAAYYFLFNASFYEWKGGLAFGPRYASAGIPLLCLGLPAVWERATPRWRKAILMLATVSIAIALMVVSTTSQLSMVDSCPLFHSTWPAFWSGQMAMNHVSMLTVDEAAANPTYCAFNLGQLIGLHGLASLLPLLASWVLAALIWMRLRHGVAG
ncbi:MAG TPA: hypothetical protein VKV39_08220 [Candidatus Sulfotelmatobacter sp.]|nr:hypothetical protein [Candidatus Sulfotelmatobacter sp.]